MSASFANVAPVSSARLVTEGECLWTPSPEKIAGCGLEHYRHWINRSRGFQFADYEALRAWSVSDLEGFWGSLWTFFDVQSDTPYRRVLDRHQMPGAIWFEGSRLNYAEHLLRHEQREPEAIAFDHSSELRPPASISWRQLGGQVRILAQQLRKRGIGPGDRVAAYMPNVPETAIAMMATVAVGAIWTCASPEFGARAVIDRLTQVQPKLLFTVDGYRFGGEDFSRLRELRQIIGTLSSIEQVIWLPYLRPEQPPALSGAVAWAQVLNQPEVRPDQFHYARVAHDHPLWILFSSGTTGLPKAIVHSHVGVLMEHFKATAFHLGLRAGSRPLFYSSTGWIMWNMLVASLLQGSAPVLYDGSPIDPDGEVLWKIAARARVTHLGISPGYVRAMQQAGVQPSRNFALPALETVLLVGSASTPETFAWIYDEVKQDVWVTSQSGGTEVASALVSGSPTLPVYAGEIQTRSLGMDVQVWDDAGSPVCEQLGELVVTQPFPSMPLHFWNDAADRRYHESYFSKFPGVWCHGDCMRMTRRGGAYILGRSDSMLNRSGVCIGTAEIYRAIERIHEVVDSLIVCCDLPGGQSFMPLFVKLKPEIHLEAHLREKIARRLREDCSPRHVPDHIYVIDAVPYTLTGKKMEVPVRKILMGWPLEQCVSLDAMMNPESINPLVRFAQESIDYRWRERADNGAVSG